MPKFKPMLAGRIESDFDLSKLRYPLLVSPKLDGIRAIVMDGRLVSRNLKLIPNGHVQSMFGKPAYEGLDGELICGSPTDKACFRNTSSAVMSYDGKPTVTYHIFDRFTQGDLPFSHRYSNLDLDFMPEFNSGTQIVEHQTVRRAEDLLEYEEKVLEEGYEGVMIRDPEGPYKYGRSTFREGWLLKMKRFLDSEAVILDVEEEMHNANEATRSLTGKLKRSSHKENMVPKGRAGTLKARDIHSGVEFNMAGLTDELKNEFWKNPPIGKIVKYKYFPIGIKDKPRHPQFVGFRDPIDL